MSTHEIKNYVKEVQECNTIVLLKVKISRSKWKNEKKREKD
jgi:hypothetical protein